MALLQEESFLYVLPLHKNMDCYIFIYVFEQVDWKANIQITGRLYNNCLNVLQADTGTQATLSIP